MFFSIFIIYSISVKTFFSIKRAKYFIFLLIVENNLMSTVESQYGMAEIDFDKLSR